VKPLGPVHPYVAPATVAVERLIVLPVQTGEFETADGAAGVEFTVTIVELAGDVQPFTVAVTL
jgi:hypothetical protein